MVRHTPLKSGVRPLPRATKPLAQVSRKRARENRTRAAVLRPLRQATDACARCGGTGWPIHGHELLSRAQGGSITDRSNIVMLCDPRNGWCEDNPKLAAEQGWKISKKWSRQ